MRHRGIRFVHVALSVSSAVLAFPFLPGIDENALLGNSASVDVPDPDDSVSASFAAERGVGVARDVTDLKNPDGVRNRYVSSLRNGTTGSTGSLLRVRITRGRRCREGGVRRPSTSGATSFSDENVGISGVPGAGRGCAMLTKSPVRRASSACQDSVGRRGAARRPALMQPWSVR